MRILILSQQYWPEPITKAGELAEGLAAAGHEVTSLTGFPNYPAGNVYDGYKLKPWSIEHVNGVRIVRTYLLPSPSENVLKYSMNLASFAATASIFGPMLSKAADVIYVRHPPLSQGIPALVLKYLRRAPLVYAMHDLWPESIVELGKINNRFLIGALDRFEKFLMRRADIVGLSSPGFVPNITGKGVPTSKIRVLPDWVDERVYFQGDPSHDVIERYEMAGKINIVFTGNMGFAQDLDTVIDAAKQLNVSAPSARFLLVGDGLERERIERRAMSESVTNVVFTGSVSPDEANRIIQCADGLLVHVRSGFLADISIASKTYSYMAVGKPILMGAAGTSKNIVEQGDLGIVFEPSNPTALADAVVKLIGLSDADRRRIVGTGPRLFNAKYSRSIGITQHEDLFKELISNRKVQ